MLRIFKIFIDIPFHTRFLIPFLRFKSRPRSRMSRDAEIQELISVINSLLSLCALKDSFPRLSITEVNSSVNHLRGKIQYFKLHRLLFCGSEFMCFLGNLTRKRFGLFLRDIFYSFLSY